MYPHTNTHKGKKTKARRIQWFVSAVFPPLSQAAVNIALSLLYGQKVPCLQSLSFFVWCPSQRRKPCPGPCPAQIHAHPESRVYNIFREWMGPPFYKTQCPFWIPGSLAPSLDSHIHSLAQTLVFLIFPGFTLQVSSSFYTKESHEIISTLLPFEKDWVFIWLQKPWFPASPPFPTHCAQNSDLGFSWVSSTMVDNIMTQECTLGGSLAFKLWLAHLPIAPLMCHKVFMDLSLLTSKLGP